jgi:uncharacterized membrane protein (DUF485 family)
MAGEFKVKAILFVIWTLSFVGAYFSIPFLNSFAAKWITNVILLAIATFLAGSILCFYAFPWVLSKVFESMMKK